MLPFTSTAIVAARYDHVSHEFQYVYMGMRELFKDHPQAFKRIIYRHSQNYHDYECTPIWGSTVRGFSTDSDDGAALLGQAFTRVVLGEGSHIATAILEKKVMRAIDGALMERKDGISFKTGYLSIYTTPKGFEGCSATEYERVKARGRNLQACLHGRVAWPETVWVREASILENPAYSRKVYEARKRSLSKAAFEEQYEGKMTFASGRVLAEFNEDIHLLPARTPEQISRMRLGVGMDTGAFFGAVLVGLDEFNIMWVLGEVYTQKNTIDDSCVEVIEMIQRVLGPAFNNGSYDVLKEKVDLWTVDPASQHKIELMDKLDITLEMPSRGQGKFELLPTLDQLRSFLRNEQLFLNDDLDWLVDEIRKYIWKTMKSIGSKTAPTVREPLKKDDHLIDALRFIAIPLMEWGPLEETREPVDWKDEWAMAQKDHLFGPLRKVMAAAKERGGTHV